MPAQKIVKRQTDYLTYSASTTQSMDIDAQGALTRLEFRVLMTGSATMVSNHAVEGLHRIINSLNVKGSGGVHYFSMGDEQIGRLLHRLNQMDGLVRGTGHGVLRDVSSAALDILFVIHFGSRPRDQFGRDNPFDLTAFIPAFHDSDLRFDWLCPANTVMDATVTVSTTYGYLTIYEVLGTAAEIKAEMAAQGVRHTMIPVSSYRAYPHTGDLSDLSCQFDVPTGAHMRRIALLSQDETATRPLMAEDQIAQVGLILPVGNQRTFVNDWLSMSILQTPLTSLPEADVGATLGTLQALPGVATVDCRALGDPDYGLDLRGVTVGNLKLGLTIENYTSGDDTFIWWDQVRGYSF